MSLTIKDLADQLGFGVTPVKAYLRKQGPAPDRRNAHCSRNADPTRTKSLWSRPRSQMARCAAPRLPKRSSQCSGIELSLKELYEGESGRELFRVCCGVLDSGALCPGSPGFEHFVSAVRARARHTPIGPVLKR